MQSIRVSQITTYQVCPRMYWFNYIKGLKPRVESNKLLFGTGIHKGLEVYYKTGQAVEAINAYKQWLAEQLDRLAMLDADPDHLSEASRIGEALLNEYIQYAQSHDNFTPIAVEQQFEVPVWTPKGRLSKMMHTGRLDMVVRDDYGNLWLGEHKTAKDFPSELDLQLNFQAGAYVLAAQQLFKEPVRGIVYNVIKKVDPRRARTPVIFRRLVPKSAEELKTMVTHLYAWARRMITDKEFLPSPGRHCGWQCAYSQLCSCMNDGSDYEWIANQMFTVSGEEVTEDDTASA